MRPFHSNLAGEVASTQLCCLTLFVIVSVRGIDRARGVARKGNVREFYGWQIAVTKGSILRKVCLLGKKGLLRGNVARKLICVLLSSLCRACFQRELFRKLRFAEFCFRTFVSRKSRLRLWFADGGNKRCLRRSSKALILR